MSTRTLRQGRFVVLGTLGEGAQGRTYDGFDRLEGRSVAIKCFDVRGAAAWKDVELAEREARVLQSLSHGKLPRYVDHFEEDGVLYLVMEKIEGESLAALRSKGTTLSEDDIVRLLRDASDVLDYLHTRAPPVIHRDIKPGNVIRRPDGSFAFVDFGAVRDKLRPDGGSTVVGTFGFMAPEQFQGRALPASDVYAVGATALNMLTGCRPEDLPHIGLAVDVRTALEGRAGERLTGVLEAMLNPDPDRRAARIAPLLERARLGADSPNGARERPARRTREPAPPRMAHEHLVDEVDEAVRRYTEQRARWEARRHARFEARRARRTARRQHGFPFPLSLIFGLAFAIGIVAVTLTTQVVVPLVLTTLSIFFARSALRAASGTVRDAGRSAVDNMERSRHWFNRETPRGAEADEARVRVEPPPTETNRRVAVDEEVAADADDREDVHDKGAAGRIR